MNILESEIEDVVFNGLVCTPDILRKTNFPFSEGFTYVRQLAIGNYGRADIVGVKVSPKRNGYRLIDIDVYELKKEKVTAETFFQADRYAKGLQRIIRNKGIECDFDVRLFLIGKSIDLSTDFVYGIDAVNNTFLYTYSIDLLHGVRFNDHRGYFLSDEGFSKKDRSVIDLLKSNINKSSIKNTDLVGDDLPF